MRRSRLNISSKNKRRVAVTGLSIIDPLGEGTNAFFERLVSGHSHSDFFECESVGHVLRIPAVTCKAFDFKGRWGKVPHAAADLYAQLGLYAALEAWEQSGLPRAAHQPRAGVSWGTALGGTRAYENGLDRIWLQQKPRASPLSVVQGMNNSCASHVAIELGLANACLTYSVACASAAMAIGEGFRRIADGYADVMVVGGSDTPLLVGVIHAWQGMRVLAQAQDEVGAQACLPFDLRRTGLMLAEGAAALILEEWDNAVARKAPILAEISGYGITCDHLNLVRPSEIGQAQAMQDALQEAGLAPSDIGYLNAHGTSTKEGDPIEVQAIKAVFGEYASTLPVSATKASHGHMMGATGAIEAAIAILSMKHDAIAPTAHLNEIDSQCLGVRHVTGSALRGTNLKAVMSNSFAFGGSNAVLVFETP